jgi:hydroxymethylpyrimidine pyrophosphatase-like HAD family hydrolase
MYQNKRHSEYMYDKSRAMKSIINCNGGLISNWKEKLLNSEYPFQVVRDIIAIVEN